MNDLEGGRKPNGLLVVGLLVIVVLAGLVAILFINRTNDSAPLATVVTPTPVPTATPTPVPNIPFADCSKDTFGPVLQPLDPPSDVHVYSAAPSMNIDVNKLYLATIVTAKGNITVCLQPNLAPNTVNVFVTLARNHFYDGLIFHRVGPDSSTPSIIQGGDPNCKTGDESTCGQGGPGFQFNDETVRQQYVAGTIAMANSGPNTNGSQFFIDTDVNQFPPSYNLFGKVDAGLDVAKKIVKGDAMTSVTVQEQT